MPKVSSGLVLYRFKERRLEVMLVHPGGPLWQHRDDGAWTIPKGELELGEDALQAAQREFEEETGVRPHGPFLALTPIRQRGGKTVHAWAFQGDCDPASIVSNKFELEWPPRSGSMNTFPEIDQAAFFPIEVAKQKINPAQVPLLEQLEVRLVDR